MSVRQHLRALTADDHARAEAAFDLDACLASRAAYAALLARLHGWQAGGDAALRLLLADAPVPWTRGEHLRADLDALGAVPAETRGFDVPLPTRAAAAGALYVVQGSALGGALVARRARERLGHDLPCAYFDDPAARAAWPAFAAWLDAAVDDLDAAVAAARLTFASFARATQL